jgi:NADH dehydrogenase
MPLRVTVFGGTGFLGRRIVRHLHDAGLVPRVASRHLDVVASLFPHEDPASKLWVQTSMMMTQ